MISKVFVALLAILAASGCERHVHKYSHTHHHNYEASSELVAVDCQCDAGKTYRSGVRVTCFNCNGHGFLYRYREPK